MNEIEIKRERETTAFASVVDKNECSAKEIHFNATKERVRKIKINMYNFAKQRSKHANTSARAHTHKKYNNGNNHKLHTMIDQRVNLDPTKRKATKTIQHTTNTEYNGNKYKFNKRKFARISKLLMDMDGRREEKCRCR